MKPIYFSVVKVNPDFPGQNGYDVIMFEEGDYYKPLRIMTEYDARILHKELDTTIKQLDKLKK